MAGRWSTRLLALSMLQLAYGLPSPTASSTTFHRALTSASTPKPTKALNRREDFDDDDFDSTITASPSVCGYFDTDLDGNNKTRICLDDYDCAWHTANGIAGGMMGCCPPTNYADCTSLYSTCYDRSQLRESTQLESISDKFAWSCSDIEMPACVTWTWPELEVSSYACGATETTETLYTWATMQYDDENAEILVTKEPLTVYDEVFITIPGRLTSGRTMPESSQSSSSLPTRPPAPIYPSSDSSDDSDESGSSVSKGAIAGGVVGGVFGVCGFAAAGYMFFLIRKRKRQENSNDQGGAGQELYTPVPGNGSPPGQESPPSTNLGAPSTLVTDGSGDYESKLNISEVEGSAVTAPVHEIDGRQYISELPAHENEIRPTR
ncbi:hypothetical protein N7457_006195 [Penicillium paradoxum]|uniref:uncharacterized protein n=1 Tax=Penicillium paradoxum TaxID=176176 RepID=UPI0025470D82|nr:uncharacterized protein N7457_006195 [Penicillium paradoxum]KAJ5781035.1 hypothetical protein N7457_006195 [Penicillium paradoxum]